MSENFSINQRQTDVITKTGYMSFQIATGGKHLFYGGGKQGVCAREYQADTTSE